MVFKNKMQTQETCERSSGTSLSDFSFPAAAPHSPQRLWEWDEMQVQRAVAIEGNLQRLQTSPHMSSASARGGGSRAVFELCVWEVKFQQIFSSRRVRLSLVTVLAKLFQMWQNQYFFPTSTKPSFGFLYTGREILSCFNQQLSFTVLGHCCKMVWIGLQLEYNSE